MHRSRGVLITLILSNFLCFTEQQNSPVGYVAFGDDASEGQFKYQVYLHFRDNTRCGGAIIDKEWILTAAHCVDDVKAKDVTVLAGTTLSYGAYINSEVSGQLRDVRNITVHEDYADDEDYGLINDIALLHLSEPLDLEDDNVDEIPILNQDFDIFDAEGEVTVSGWGRTEDGMFPDDLQFTSEIQLYRGGFCGNRLEKYSQICTLSTRDGGYNADACKGDSGGPLTFRTPGDTVDDAILIGLVSFGENCPFYGNEPGVYTYVPPFFNWIVEKINEEGSVDPDDDDDDNEENEVIGRRRIPYGYQAKKKTSRLLSYQFPVVVSSYFNRGHLSI